MNDNPDVPQVLAEVAVEPVAGGADHHQHLDAALRALQDPALDVKVQPLSTLLAGSLDDVLSAVRRAHAVVTDAERVVTTVRLESRRGGIDLSRRRVTAAGMQPPEA